MDGKNMNHKCKHCGAEFPKEGLFCPICGTKYEETKPEIGKKQSSKAALIGMIVLVAAILVVGGFFASKFLDQKNADKVDMAEQENVNSREDADITGMDVEDDANIAGDAEIENDADVESGAQQEESSEQAETSKMTEDTGNKYADLFQNKNVGDRVFFGHMDSDIWDYVSSDYEEESDVSWVIVDKKGSKVLLLSEYVVCEKRYNDDYEETCWEKSTLRHWLNSEFLNCTFNEEEKNLIVKSTLENYGFEFGENDVRYPHRENLPSTKDYVFLLSYEEMENYFEEWDDGVAYYINMEAANWWLRNRGENGWHSAATILEDGFRRYSGDVVDEWDIGVRPAIWVKIDRTKEFSEKTDKTEKVKDESEESEETEEWVLPECDSRYYKKSELLKLSKEELRLAVNELYARHGYKFSTKKLRKYFKKKSWYVPKRKVVDDSMFNQYEIHNRDLIVQIEKEMGY